MTVRAGGIIAGTYDAGPPYSAGDGAPGVEAALMERLSVITGSVSMAKLDVAIERSAYRPIS